MLSEVRKLSEKLRKSGETLALAESCTGGLVASAVTSLPGASDFFAGSIVSYSDQAKTRVLKIPPKYLKNSGAISKTVALMMAKRARKVLNSDWAVSVTGLAGPAGGSKNKPVGLVFFAAVGPKVEVVQKKIFKGNRKQVQQRATLAAIALLLKLV